MMKTAFPLKSSKETKSRAIISTLYDLIEALGEAIQPGEERLVPIVVLDLMQSGQLRFLRQRGSVIW
jgi:hypothetical protein